MVNILKSINNYYSEKIKEHGAKPAGVDWNGEDSQILRFEKLCSVINKQENFSLNDLGCGYGKLVDYLQLNYPGQYEYVGYDLSNEMILAAKKKYGESSCVKFFKINSPSEMHCGDYTVASGIFNVKMHHSESDWLVFIIDTLDLMNKKSRLGYSFNLLTKYSDPEFMKNNLFYADPCILFDYCKRNHSKKVSLLHNYNLYEFTMIVDK